MFASAPDTSHVSRRNSSVFACAQVPCLTMLVNFWFLDIFSLHFSVVVITSFSIQLKLNIFLCVNHIEKVFTLLELIKNFRDFPEFSYR